MLASDDTFNKILMYFAIIVRIHGSELQECKRFAKLAEALLLVEDRPLGTELDQQSNKQKHGREKQERSCTSSDVDQSLNDPPKALCLITMKKIRVESRIALCGLLDPVFRENVQRNTDLTEVPQGEVVPQRLANPAHHGAENRSALIDADSGKHNSDDRVRLIPTGDVSFTCGTG